MTDRQRYTLFLLAASLLLAFACSAFVPSYHQWDYAVTVYAGFVLVAVVAAIVWIWQGRDGQKRKR